MLLGFVLFFLRYYCFSARLITWSQFSTTGARSHAFYAFFSFRRGCNWDDWKWPYSVLFWKDGATAKLLNKMRFALLNTVGWYIHLDHSITLHLNQSLLVLSDKIWLVLKIHSIMLQQILKPLVFLFSWNIPACAAHHISSLSICLMSQEGRSSVLPSLSYLSSIWFISPHSY